MKRILRKIFSFKTLIWVVIIGAVVAGISFSKKKNAIPSETIPVTRGTVVETVAVTGQVKPKTSAQLKFKIPGIIRQLLVDVGDVVREGQLLGRLEDSDLRKKLIEADAQVKAAKVAVMNADQNVKDTQVKNDKDLNSLYVAAPTTFIEINNLVQQVYAGVVSFFDAQGNLMASISGAIANTQLIIDANLAYKSATGAFTKLTTSLANYNVNASRAQIDGTLGVIHLPLQELSTAVSRLIATVNGVTIGTISQTSLDAYKATLAAMQTNMNSAITKEVTLNKNLQETLVTSQLNLNTARSQYNDAVAKLDSAKASFEVAQRNVDDANLYAPIAGTIAAKSKNIGESVAITDNAYFILGDAGLEITANISEVDIAKVKLGDTAKVTLDAYGSGRTFDVRVSSIDPAETIVDGVATYKTTFVFLAKEAVIRSGMTANILITTQTKQNVLVIPARAITSKSGDKTVRVKVGEGERQATITTGLRGVGGTIEVLSGLHEGDVLIIGPTNG